MRALALLVALVLLAGIGAVALRPRPSADALTPRSESVSPAESAPAPALAEAPARVEVERERRAQPAAATEADGGALREVRGLVAMPAHRPPDEHVAVRVRSGGRGGGEQQIVDVGADGSFPASIRADARWQRFELEAKYLRVLDEPSFELDELVEPVVIRAEPCGRIEGRLVLPEDVREDELPPARTRVQLWALRERAWYSAKRVRLDDELRFVVEALEPGDYRVTASLPAFVPHERRAQVHVGRTTEVALELLRGAALAGRVVEPEGTPVEGANVRVRDERGTETDAEGRFALTGISPGDHLLDVETPGVVKVEHALGELADGERVEDLEIVVGAGLALRGVVFRPDGAPAHQARVVAVERRDDGGKPWRALRLETRTDAEGRFRLAGLEPMRFDVAASLEPSARARPWTAYADATAGATLVLTLGAGARVAGRVVDDRGEPLEQFEVRAQFGERELETYQPQLPQVSHSFRDARGEFELTGLHAGRWLLVASAPGHADSEPALVDASGGILDIALVAPRSARIAGRVLDAVGAPVAGASVSCRTCTSVEGGRRGLSLPDAHVVSDDEGAFELLVRPGRVDLGTYVRAPSGGHRTTSLCLTVAPAQERTGVVLELPPD